MKAIVKEIQTALEDIKVNISEGKPLSNEERQILFLTALAKEAQNGES